MNGISKICVTLVKIIPTAWVMLGLEYGACWWEYPNGAYELVTSASGALLIAWLVIFVGDHLAREGEDQTEAPALKSCVARIGGELLVLALISAAIST